jgi:hypothetical protein
MPHRGVKRGGARAWNVLKLPRAMPIRKRALSVFQNEALLLIDFILDIIKKNAGSRFYGGVIAASKNENGGGHFGIFKRIVRVPVDKSYDCGSGSAHHHAV